MRCGAVRPEDPRPSIGSALQRLHAAAAQEIVEVCEEAPRCTLAEAARGWLMAARFAMWRVRAAEVAAIKGNARPAGLRRYVDGLRSRLLWHATGWKGDVHYQVAAVRGGPESSVERTPSLQAQVDHTWRYRWQQGGFSLLEAATRRHTRERNARRLELAKGQQVRFLWLVGCAAE